MSSPFEVTAEAIEDPAAEKWLRTALKLARACAKEVHGVEQSSGFDTVLVHVAALQIWRATGGQPCWSRLDVPALMRWVKKGLSPEACEEAALSMLTFYTFLAKHGHIPRTRHPARRELEARAAPLIVRLLSSYHPLARWRRSPLKRLNGSSR